MKFKSRALGVLTIAGCLWGGFIAPAAAASYPQPFIQTWGPTQGPPGTVVTVKGRGFTGLNEVRVGTSRDAEFNVLNDKQVRFTVPTNATSGQIALLNPQRGAWSPNAFTLTAGATEPEATPPPATEPVATPPPATEPVAPAPGEPLPQPYFQSWGPTSGGPGTVITVEGSGFTGLSQAWVGNARDARFEVVSDRSVRITVPTNATSGQIALLNPERAAWSPNSFTFTSDSVVVTNPEPSPAPVDQPDTTPDPVVDPDPMLPVPMIASFQPLSGPTGTVLTVTGSGFSGATTAQVGEGSNASVTVISDTQATVIVPGNATTGAVTIANASHSGSSGQLFSVTVPIVPAPVAGDLAIRVQGRHLVDASGAVIQLRGVNVSGLEFTAIQGWSPSDPTGGQSGQPHGPNWAAIKSWKANSVRIPLNEASWLGYSCTDTAGVVHNPDPGGNYRETVQRLVQEANDNGLYVILDLHWTAPDTSCPMLQTQMANADHSLDFWDSLARAFKHNPSVIFELFNEPFMNFDFTGNTWEYMMQGTGGSFGGYPATGGNWTHVKRPWDIASFQAMIDTVRATGATNVLLIGGMQYAQDLSGWLQYRPTDPLGQMGAAWHPYRKFQTAWDYPYPNFYPEVMQHAQDILAAGYPIVMTEVGGVNAPGTPSSPIIDTMTRFADEHGISALGWGWNLWTYHEDVLIKDAQGTPTDGYGVAYRNWMQSHQ